MSMRALVVGERWNVADPSRYARLAAMREAEPRRWLAWSRRAGALGTGLSCEAPSNRRAAARLARLGLDVGGCDGLNLLEPAACSAWDAAAAAAVMAELGVLLEDGARARDGLATADARLAESWRYDIIVLAGGRVARSARYAEPMLEPAEGSRVVLVPHPSGLSRWWNDEVDVDLGRDALEAFLEAWSDD